MFFATIIIKEWARLPTVSGVNVFCNIHFIYIQQRLGDMGMFVITCCNRKALVVGLHCNNT